MPFMMSLDMKNPKMKFSLMLAAFAALSTSALADSVTATMSVAASVPAACSVNADALSFPDYVQVDTDAVANVSLTCISGTSAVLSIDAGQGTTPGSRSMTLNGGSATLNYGLFQDGNHSIPFSTTPGAGENVTGTGTLQTIPVYGRIPGGQVVPAGSYLDSVLVTVTY